MVRNNMESMSTAAGVDTLVVNKWHADPIKGATVTGACYENSCASAWVFAIMPSCITNHRNSALPATSVLHYVNIGNSALSGRFALLHSDDRSYMQSLKQFEHHVRKFLKQAMRSELKAGHYLNASLTIVAHGRDGTGDVELDSNPKVASDTKLTQAGHCANCFARRMHGLRSRIRAVRAVADLS